MVKRSKDLGDVDLEEVLKITKEMGIDTRKVKEGEKAVHKIKNRDGEYVELDIDKVFEGFKNKPMGNYYYVE